MFFFLRGGSKIARISSKYVAAPSIILLVGNGANHVVSFCARQVALGVGLSRRRIYKEGGGDVLTPSVQICRV